MLYTRKSTLLWLTGGIIFSLLVLLVVSGGLAGNVTIADPEGIPEAAEAVMNHIREGSWQALEEMVSGHPGITPITGTPGSPEHRIYDAFRSSLQWTLEDTFELQGSYITQKLTVTCLDIQAVTEAMAAVMADTGSNTDLSQQGLLQSAAQQVLEQELPVIQREVTLTFRREQGLWQLVANKELQALLSGFTVH